MANYLRTSVVNLESMGWCWTPVLLAALASKENSSLSCTREIFKCKADFICTGHRFLALGQLDQNQDGRPSAGAVLT